MLKSKLPIAELYINLAPIKPKIKSGSVLFNQIHGGPEDLLKWVETQFGVLRPKFPQANLINELASRLDSKKEKLYFKKSFQIDRWGTSAELLARVHDLRLAGWKKEPHPSLPPFLNDIADVSQGYTFNFLDISDRLEKVLDCFKNGMVLPKHKLFLSEPLPSWPTIWQTVLNKMDYELVVEKQTPLSPPNTSLYLIQNNLSGKNRVEIKPDDSFRFITSQSTSLACEYLANIFAKNLESLGDTVVLCENDDIAFYLDATLNRKGLPTMGVKLGISTHPVYQLLPLTLALLWEPVDPQVLLDYLTLPLCPIPSYERTSLARSLLRMPGFGSKDWLETLKKIEENPKNTSNNSDKFKDRYEDFLNHERIPRGDDLPTKLVSERFKKLAQWAAGYASFLEEKNTEINHTIYSNKTLEQGLKGLAGQASDLANLIELQGEKISGPQVTQLLRDHQTSGVGSEIYPNLENGPVHVRSLSEIRNPFKCLIWLGVGTNDQSRDLWPKTDKKTLKEICNFNLPDLLVERQDLRKSEVLGFCKIEKSFLCIQLPSDETQVWHPLWIQIRNMLPKNLAEQPPVLDSVISGSSSENLNPFQPDLEEREIIPPRKAIPLWEFPKGSIIDRDTVSATDLQDKLACPLKWVFSKQLLISSGSISRLPADAKLNGNFCHQVLDLWFTGNPNKTDPEKVAEEVARIFNERLAFDAAPLAQPDNLLKANTLRNQLVQASKTLIKAMIKGNYRILKIESPIEGEAFGKILKGSIDCLAQKCEESGEAIIDFKMYGTSKYSKMLEDGKAIQLATYAYSRKAAKGSFPAVAYLILGDSQLKSPTGSALDGLDKSQTVSGPTIKSVWDEFTLAFNEANDWLNQELAVPARPLQDSSQWPKKVELVLNPNLKINEQQEVCKYCNFKSLCGLKPLV